jgi:hypothetical protein
MGYAVIETEAQRVEAGCITENIDMRQENEINRFIAKVAYRGIVKKMDSGTSVPESKNKSILFKFY